MNFSLLQQIFEERKEPAFRVKQVKQAIFLDCISAWTEATTFSKDLRSILEERVPFSSITLLREARSERGDTIKAAFELHDGNIIETVLMRHHGDRNTVCVSSMAGCPMRCAFCATGLGGFKRNLTSEEITDQVLYFMRLLHKEEARVSNIVVMGMGEPMNNYENVVGALRILNDKDGANISARKMTISTCGIVPGILRLAEEPEQFNLAISLHAPTDELRTKIMPINRAYPLAKLMEAIETYLAKTNRKVLFEYLMIDGVNDTRECADALAKLMRHPLYQVNLIKYHDTGVFHASNKERRSTFKKWLEAEGAIVTERVSFGEDIDAACGQLAGKTKKATAEPLPNA